MEFAIRGSVVGGPMASFAGSNAVLSRVARQGGAWGTAAEQRRADAVSRARRVIEKHDAAVEAEPEPDIRPGVVKVLGSLSELRRRGIEQKRAAQAATAGQEVVNLEAELIIPEAFTEEPAKELVSIS